MPALECKTCVYFGESGWCEKHESKTSANSGCAQWKGQEPTHRRKYRRSAR